MAYNSHFNPDALPAHAEPDQAAQILAQQHYQKPASRPHSNSSSAAQSPQITSSSYQNKPPPPVPSISQNLQQSQHQPQHQYRRHSPNSSNLSSVYTPNETNYSAAALQNHHPHATGPYNPPVLSPPHTTGPYKPPIRSPPHITGPYNPPIRSPPPSHSPKFQYILPVAGVDPSLFPLFKAVDKRGTGQLGEEELGAALVNGDFTSFDPQTVRMMIHMFDVDKNGSIGYDEFCRLWGFLADWRTLFERFDEDNSGTISYDEYSKALLSFGYHVSTQFVMMLFRMYDKKGTNSMSFDMFVQSFISLKRMTDVFKKYDTDRDGYIMLSFEEFLTEILQQR